MFTSSIKITTSERDKSCSPSVFNQKMYGDVDSEGINMLLFEDLEDLWETSWWYFLLETSSSKAWHLDLPMLRPLPSGDPCRLVDWSPQKRFPLPFQLALDVDLCLLQDKEAFRKRVWPSWWLQSCHSEKGLISKKVNYNPDYLSLLSFSEKNSKITTNLRYKMR